MPSVCNAKLIGTTWNDRFIHSEVYIKSCTTITYEVEVVLSLGILQHLIRCMQIDVFQSERVHSRKDLKALMLCKKAL